ncbi:hypothetical protein OK006_10920, partial [Actinobacteria bacterium OK006]
RRARSKIRLPTKISIHVHRECRRPPATCSCRESSNTCARELADYVKAFAGLAEMAVYGDGARDLIRAAIDTLE